MSTLASDNAVYDLEQRIRRLYDHLYANSSKRTPGGISIEVGKILHAGQFIEEVRHQPWAFDFSKSELKGLSKGTGELVGPVADALRREFKAMNAKWRLYSRGTEIELSDADIAVVTAQLAGVVISDRNRDVFGDAVEIFRSQWAKREGGMFFTDQRVTHLAMALLDFDPRNGDDLVDISAGTGGFLSAGLNRIRYVLERDEPGPDVETRVVELALNAIKGHEIDPDVARVANATLASRTGHTEHCFVHVGDSIAPEAFGKGYALGLREGLHKCAASNPPFGTKTTIKDDRVLRTYELARMTSRGSGDGLVNGCYTRPPDILLLERNIRLLQAGHGRLAIVLPYQLLSGPQCLYVREWLLRNTEIQAVIDLPSETFQPHTGTKTSLVVVKRRETPLEEAKSDSSRRIFMAVPRWIGHDRRGNPVYERSPEGKETKRVLSDFENVEAAFDAFRNGDDPTKTYAETYEMPEDWIYADPLRRMNAMFHQPSRNKTIVSPKSRRWKTVRVRDVVSRIYFPGRFKRNYVDRCDGAVPFFGGSNITEFIIHTDKWLDPTDPKLDGLRVRAGWLLVTRSGSTGIVSSVPPAWDGYAMSEHVIRIIPDNSKMSAEYLQAYLRTPQAQEVLAKGVFGSVIDEINPESIGDLEVPVPRSKAEIDKIVKSMRIAEAARQTAIEDLYGAVEELTMMLNRQ